MKRFVSVLLCMAMLFSCCAIFGSAAEIVYGDVDGDKKITAADARKVLRYSVNLENFTADQKKAADVDLSNKVDSADARLVLRGAVNLDWPGDFGLNGSQMFNRGTYLMKVTVSGSDTPFVIANAEGCSYMEIKVDFAEAFDKPEAKPVDMGILTLDDASYMVLPAMNTYLRLDDELSASGGFNMSEIVDMFGKMNTSGTANAIPDLISTVKENNETYTTYTYNSTDNTGKTIHYLQGSKLCMIRTYDESNTLETEMIVESITTKIPDNIVSIPDDATKLGGEAGMMGFMLQVVAISGLTLDDLQ